MQDDGYGGSVSGEVRVEEDVFERSGTEFHVTRTSGSRIMTRIEHAGEAVFEAEGRHLKDAEIRRMCDMFVRGMEVAA